MEGIKFGRPRKKIPDNFYEVAKKWKLKEISLRQGAKILETSPSMFSKWLEENNYK